MTLVPQVGQMHIYQRLLKERIVFLGTPEFATASLNAILHSNHEVVGVVTAPDKPAGRGQQLSESDVKKFAVQHNLPLFQPEKLRDESFLDALRNLQADVFVVVANHLRCTSRASKSCGTFTSTRAGRRLSIPVL